jgi:hypothetical protein
MVFFFLPRLIVEREKYALSQLRDGDWRLGKPLFFRCFGLLCRAPCLELSRVCVRTNRVGTNRSVFPSRHVLGSFRLFCTFRCGVYTAKSFEFAVFRCWALSLCCWISFFASPVLGHSRIRRLFSRSPTSMLKVLRNPDLHVFGGIVRVGG